MKYFLMFGVLFMSGMVVTGGVPEDTALKQRMDQYLAKGVPQGFSGNVLVAREGRIILHKGYGLANREAGKAYGPDTITTIGSVTKQFTGAAILKLVEQGKLKVSDPLETWFDRLPADKKQITIHQLLTHSSGLRELEAGDFDHIPTEAFFDRVFAAELAYQPGSTHRYSNVGYSVLGRIIELVSGVSYESFLQTHLFQPAGMNHTGYLKPKWTLDEVAHGYGHGAFPMGSLIDRFQRDGKISWVLKANGGIHSTLGDMYLWYQALKGNRVLSPQSFEAFTKPWIAEDESGSSHYGYGWALFKSSRGGKIISHNGGNGIYFFDFIWFPAEDALVLFSTNAWSPRVEVAWKLAKMMFDDQFQPKPIGKSPMTQAVQFIMQHQADRAGELFASLRQDFPGESNNPRLLNRLGYDLLDVDGKQHWALAVFEENARRFPEVANVWDSLGDGYLAVNKKAKAMESFQKAADMGLEHSARRLKELQTNNP